MKLFGHPDSGHAYKVRLFLRVADIAHDYELVDIWQPREARSEEFRRNARFQEVPLLIDEGVPHVQSNAILIHLARRQGGWGAEEPRLFDRCVEWLCWEANRIGMCLPQLRAAARFEPEAFDEGALRWLRARYAHDVALLDEELADGRAFVNGDAPTIVDFSLSGYLFFAEEAGAEVPVHVERWLERIASLPRWRHPYELMST